jgi:hypothetical protein
MPIMPMSTLHLTVEIYEVVIVIDYEKEGLNSDGSLLSSSQS